MAPFDTALPLVADGVDIPDSAYDKAEKRYKDLGEWLCREGSEVARYDPSVFPQGSFLLGTVIRPVGSDEEYDLDLGCTLKTGVGKSTHSQEQLKVLLGRELEAYRRARGIADSLDEKRRCWRLDYQDELAFHMDVVPCIPERDGAAGLVKEAMVSRGADEALASEVAGRAVSITDNELPNYRVVSPAWLLSNPEGYARWFQSRVELAPAVRDRLLLEKRAEVVPIPANRRKAPLQRVVQLLKRHRGIMFRDDPERQPISVIITTLAARAYGGEATVEEALAAVLAAMGEHVQTTVPRVENPVNPSEDFADKWGTKEGLALGLENNFKNWLREAQRDFKYLAETRDSGGIEKRAEEALGLKLDERLLRERFGPPAGAPAVHTRVQSIVAPPKQWQSA